MPMMIAPEGYSYSLVVEEPHHVAYYVAAPAQLSQVGWEEAGFERLMVRVAGRKEPMVSLSIFYYTTPQQKARPEEHYYLRDADWARTCAAIESVGFVLSSGHGRYP